MSRERRVFTWLAFFVVLFSVETKAQTASAGSELFWQPNVGRIAVTSRYFMATDKETGTDGTGEYEQERKGSGAEITYEYGLFSLMAVGAGGSYSAHDIELIRPPATTGTETEQKGFQDSKVFLKMRLPLGRTAVYLGGTYFISPDDKDFNTLTSTHNNSTGANSVDAHFGVQYSMGPINLGFRSNLRTYEKRTIASNGVKTHTARGGNELDFLAHMEYYSMGGAFGVGAGVFQVEKLLTTTLATTAVSTQDSYSASRFKVYMRWGSWFLQGDWFRYEEQDLGSKEVEKRDEVISTLGFRLHF